MKEIFFALIVWSNGAAGSYDMESERACVALTQDLALLVESANCYSDLRPVGGYRTAPMYETEPWFDYYPPEN